MNWTAMRERFTDAEAYLEVADCKMFGANHWVVDGGYGCVIHRLATVATESLEKIDLDQFGWAFMIHGMNAKWETECVLDEPAMDAERLSELLACVCANSLQPDFKLSDDYARRQAARRRFSPSLSYGRHFCPPLPTARAAAVMIFIEPHDGRWSIPLTVRPDHLPDHPGQVCLPGGRVEGNETLEQAAEREFCEELGLDCFPATTIGQLQSLYVYNSNFCLTPCVAVSPVALKYRPCSEEVESLVYLPLSDLIDPQYHVERIHRRGLASWHALGIDAAHVHIWGATAIVLGELAEVLRGQISN